MVELHRGVWRDRETDEGNLVKLSVKEKLKYRGKI